MRDKDEILLEIIITLDNLKQDYPLIDERKEDLREILNVHIEEYKKIIKNIGGK